MDSDFDFVKTGCTVKKFSSNFRGGGGRNMQTAKDCPGNVICSGKICYSSDISSCYIKENEEKHVSAFCSPW